MVQFSLSVLVAALLIGPSLALPILRISRDPGGALVSRNLENAPELLPRMETSSGNHAATPDDEQGPHVYSLAELLPPPDFHLWPNPRESEAPQEFNVKYTNPNPADPRVIETVTATLHRDGRAGPMSMTHSVVHSNSNILIKARKWVIYPHGLPPGRYITLGDGSTNHLHGSAPYNHPLSHHEPE